MRRPGFFTVVFLMALGGAITLVAQPVFPDSWTAWVADVQSRIHRAGGELVSETARPAPPTETYQLVPIGDLFSFGTDVKVRTLATTETWTGTGDRSWSFKSDRTPWILWWEATRTSGLGSKFEVYVKPSNPDLFQALEVEATGGLGVLVHPQVFGTNGNYILMHDQGRVGVTVKVSGVRWTAKAAREP